MKNYHVSVKEMGNQIVFLRKLGARAVPEHSFGIHVARMAGMPASVVARAEEILRNLELVYGNNEIVPSRSLKDRGSEASARAVKEAAESVPQNMQLSMFQLDDPVLVQIRDQIKGLDINALTPIEALNKLNEIKRSRDSDIAPPVGRRCGESLKSESGKKPADISHAGFFDAVS